MTLWLSICFKNILLSTWKGSFVPFHINFFYASDGAASQHKNQKNFINLCHHEEDFGVAAKWQFSATSHGKGACDRVGDTVKRLAAKASLQRPYDQQIMTPRQLFDWAVDNIPAMAFKYLNMDDYKNEQILLEQRIKQSCTISGTHKLHCFIPLSRNKVFLLKKVYSSSAISKIERVTVQKGDLVFEEIKGFVTRA